MLKKIQFNTNLIYFVVISLFVCLRIASSLSAFTLLGQWASTIMSFVTQIGIIFLLPLLLFKVLNKASLKDTFKFCSYKKTSWKVILAAVGLGFVVFILNVYVSSFFNSIIRFFGFKPNASSGAELPVTWWSFALDLITTAILPGICEETLHRGMLLKGNSTLGIKKSIIISSVLFGLLHLNIEQFFYATIIGIFLGYLCLMCNSIYPCMIIHFMNNGISVFLNFAASKGWAIGSIFGYISEFASKNILLGGIFFVLLLALIVVLGLELTKFVMKESFKYSFDKRQKQLANMAIRENYFKQIDDIKNGNLQEKPLFSAEKQVVYLDMAQFVKFIEKNISVAPNDSEKISSQSMKELEIKTKILLWASIALGAIVTIMTFIWGLFR